MLTLNRSIEELKALNDQRKILLPDNLPPSPPLEPVKMNGEAKTPDVEELTTADASGRGRGHRR